jgi:hypothetical protein
MTSLLPQSKVVVVLIRVRIGRRRGEGGISSGVSKGASTHCQCSGKLKIVVYARNRAKEWGDVLCFPLGLIIAGSWCGGTK